MLGLRLNLIFIILTLTFVSCGKAPEVSGAPQFIAGQIITPGDGSGLSIDRRLARTWRDYDGDGVSDRLDWDMDGDGVANLLDQYPLNELKWGADNNSNGITDFVDLSLAQAPELHSLAFYQELIFHETGVVVIHGSDVFTQDEWKAIYQIMSSKQLREKVGFSGVKLIVKYDKNAQADLRRADFDASWNQISLYQNEEHQNSILSFRGSLIHEFGHVYALENSEIYSNFKAQFPDWSSPSLYGETSSEEGFAENFAHELFQAGLELDVKRFDLL